VSEYVALVRTAGAYTATGYFSELNPQLHYPKATNYLLDAQFIARLEFMFAQ